MMKFTKWGAGALVQAIALVACAPETHALKIGDTEFQVEVAETEQAQRAGLSGRRKLPEGTGMLFVFAGKQEQQVWMAGMQVSLDIAWLVDGRVLAVDTLDPCDIEDQEQCPRWTSPAPIDALLEVPAGELAGVEPGERVSW